MNMRTLVTIFLLLSLHAICNAQTKTIDSLKQLLQTEKQDTSRIRLLKRLSRSYLYSKPDTSLLLCLQGLSLSQDAKFTMGEAFCLEGMADAFDILGNYPESLENYLMSLKIYETINDVNGIRRCLGNLGTVYAEQGEYRRALEYSFKAKEMALNNESAMSIHLLNIGDDYNQLKIFDSAKIYNQKSYELAMRLNNIDIIGCALTNLGETQSGLDEKAVALQYFRRAVPYLQKAEDDDIVCEVYLDIAILFGKTHQPDSSLKYAQLAFAIAKAGGFTKRIYDASIFLTDYYKNNRIIDSAFAYQNIAIAAKDSLFSKEKQREIQKLSYRETIRQQQIIAAKEEAQTQLKFNALLGSIATLLIVAFILYRNNRQRKKANKILEFTVDNLKATQAQLIQSEKMASLGELTAGIAHEIQNPLNFVNNFSEVNTELIDELEAEAGKGNIDEVKVIAKDLRDNEQKILHHGKRADAIVKGMLQHSRASTGKKEATDINALADEYLRLSYHGLRAKDKTFNATLQTNYDATIGKINIVPQDIGRVLLNLFNNAFYAVSEKKKLLDDKYDPIVSLYTKKTDDKIEIHVKDNGNGIPQKAVDKIFQPFFTTKPTGQGTGLGLSLSYDIIKAHGGEIRVETKEGEGSEFLVQLRIA
jgi:signal transduction histidine kinase